MGGRDRVGLDERLLLRRERGGGLCVVAAVDDDGQAPFGDPRGDDDVELERRRADLREPEAELLDEVEREPVAARRLRRPQERLQLDLLAGRDRPREARRAGRPRRSRCPGRRASGRRAARRSPGASATSPCRRSGARRARARRRPPGAPAGRGRATEPRAGRPERDARRLAPCTQLAYCRDVRGSPSRPRGAPRADRAHAGVVHAPGGPLAAGVPRDPEDAHALRGLLRAGALRRGDAPAGAPPRRRRGRDVRGHHAAAARDGRRGRARRERRPRDRRPDPQPCPGRRAPRPRAGGGGAVHPRGDLDRAPRAAPRPGGDRLLRRPVHGRRLPDRGEAQPGVPEREADDVLGAGALARADGEADRLRSRSTSRARCGRAPT